MQNAAVSANGRLVAVSDLNDNVVVHDAVTGDEQGRVSNDQPAYVEDFSDRVLYGVGADSLRLGLSAHAIDVPVSDGPVWGTTGEAWSR